MKVLGVVLQLLLFQFLNVSKTKTETIGGDEKVRLESAWKAIGETVLGEESLPATVLDFQNKTKSLLSIFNSTTNSIFSRHPLSLVHSKLHKNTGFTSSSLQHLKDPSEIKHIDHSDNWSLTADLDEGLDDHVGIGTGSRPKNVKNWKKEENKDNAERELEVLKEGGKWESAVDALSLTDDLEKWEAPPEFRKHFPYYLAGYDDQDRPVWIAEMGKYGVREVMEQGAESVDILRKYAKQAAYRIIQSIEEQSRPEREVTKAIFIIDFDGLTLNQMAHAPTILFALNLARSYKDLILNRLQATIVINANYFAQLLINMVRPVFGRVMEKTQVYGVDTMERKKWTGVLSELLPPETIPSWYGGYPNYKPVKVYE